MELDKIIAGDFKQLLNEKLPIQFTPEVQLVAELIALTELNGYSPLERKPFSITFRTDQKTEYYNQGIFMVVHPSKGELPIFMSPKGFDGVGMNYEAVFS